MGRPPKPVNERKGTVLRVRVTPLELKRIEQEAKRLGVTLSEVLMRPWRKGEN